MNFFRILFFLSSFLIFAHSTNCFSKPKHTFPNLISLRTKQYPLGKYKKIIIRTPLRTGSTLVYNVVRTLFEHKEYSNTNGRDSSVTLVSKEHIEPNSPSISPDCLYICTYRNPYETLKSRLLTTSRNSTLKPETYISLIKNIVKNFLYLSNLREKSNVLFLKYEQFEDSSEYIFKKLERHLAINIHIKDKLLIYKSLSKNKVLEFIKEFDDFSKLDRVSHFHGSHISSNSLPVKQQKQALQTIYPILKENRSLFREFGYNF